MSMSAGRIVYTSESVTEGHPDKVCDLIADTILDAHLAQDSNAHVACEVLAKAGDVILAGEITSRATVDHVTLARRVIEQIGYTDPAEPFNANAVTITSRISRQAGEIGTAVSRSAQGDGQLGAGDQGMMIGYATDETPELMPLPILLAHRLSLTLSQDRKHGTIPWLRPDGKTQVSVEYCDGRPERVTRVVVSTQHARGVRQDEVKAYVREQLVPSVLGIWLRRDTTVTANPSGSFAEGGPSADCGVTGRKIIADTYGGLVRHGGGAFSGKDPTKVDRSGAYFCRYVARNLVKEGLARRAEISVAYAIGESEPVHVAVHTFGTGDEHEAVAFVTRFDFRPAAIIERLGLSRPIYARTTNYGHFGRAGLPWEE
jgi:S-adenosylmethionine synthetase